MNSLPFKIKICGVTSLDDASVAVANGAQALGLNFYRNSTRLIDVPTAAAIALAYGDMVPIVAVVVDHTFDEIESIGSVVDFSWIQLHGTEPPQFVEQLKRGLNLPIIRAFRWRTGEQRIIENYLAESSRLGCVPDAILIDSYSPDKFGGTGQIADWNAIAEWRAQFRIVIPIVLAGGLTAKNVADAIRTVRPDAVDSASGVESSTGRKDPHLVAEFSDAALQSLG